MKPCFCNRLYRIIVPTTTMEYVFNGSLCSIREFQTLNGSHYCLTIFSLYDYKHLHFPNDEYKWITSKLYALLSTTAIKSNATNSDVLTIKQQPFNSDFKIKFGKQNLTIGSVTAFGLVKTTPFTDFVVSSDNKNRFTCDSKWDICICGTCPVFRRMCDFEARAREIFPQRRPVNVVFDTTVTE